MTCSYPVSNSAKQILLMQTLIILTELSKQAVCEPRILLNTDLFKWNAMDDCHAESSHSMDTLSTTVMRTWQNKNRFKIDIKI